jgi:hypothetical protein
MSQPLGGCPECGASQPFEQVHAVAGECPDVPDGDCPEWACQSCGAAVIMGILPVPAAHVFASPLHARQPVHAA